MIPSDKFADFHFGKPLGYESLVHALLKAGSQVGCSARVEKRLTYPFTDISISGATLKKSAVSMPLRLRIYGHAPQSKIGVYFDEPNLYYRFFPVKYIGRGLEIYAKALKGIIDKMPGIEPPSDDPTPLPPAGLMPPPEPPEEPLEAVGVRVPNRPRKPLVAAEKVSVH